MLHLRVRHYLSTAILLLLFLLPRHAEGRFINLGGSLDLSYGEIKTEQESLDGGKVTDKTTFFQQRYNLHNFGELFNPRIGTILLNGTYLKQDTDTDGRGDQDFHFNDYSVALNLLPYISPLSLYYQRVNRVNKLDQDAASGLPAETIKDRLTTIGGNWSFSSSRLPRISLSYNQSELESPDNANRLPNTINRFLNLESSGRIGETTVIGRYQYNEADVARVPEENETVGKVDTIRGNAFNLTTESRLAPALIVSTFSRIANRGGGNATGVSFAQERGVGASLFYTPSVKWDTHARIDYSETPSGGGGNAVDLKRQNLFWSGTYRPNEELDMVMSGRYFRFDVSDVKTTSPFIDYHINYRPFFGFSTGIGASYGETSTKGGGTKVDNTFQRYRGHLNYTRAIEFLRYSSSYSLSYGLSDTDGRGESTDLMNTITLGVENTRIRFVHIAVGYTFNDIQRDIPKSEQIQNVPQEGKDSQELGDQQSHRFQINADSSYFRGLLQEDDSLFLQSTASWTMIDGFGPDGTTFLFDTRGNYYFMRGGLLSLGYTLQDYPGGFYLDSDTYYEELRYSFYLGATQITLGARANQERADGDSSLDRDTIQTTSTAAYRVGKFVFSLDGRWSEDRSKSVSNGQEEDITFRSQSIFARMSRSF